MKQSKLVILLMVAFMLISWLSVLVNIDGGNNGEYQEHLEMAAEYESRGLYRKAVEEYDAAIAIEGSEETWTKKLASWEKACEENPKMGTEYRKAAEIASTLYPNNVEFLLTAAKSQVKQDDYHSACRLLERAMDRGIEDETIRQLLQELSNAYELSWDVYEDYRESMEGFAVLHNGTWSYVDGRGVPTKFTNLQYAGPIGENGVRVVTGQEKTYLVDANEIKQGYLDAQPQQTGVYAEGLIPISDGTAYYYYSSIGDKVLGPYDQAGSFTGGQAAVQTGGSWILIDAEGNQVSDGTYEEIRLHLNGTHLQNGVMLAKQDGSWHIIKDGKSAGSYEDVAPMADDDLIAFCSGGKWGFADSEGNEVIAPTFAQAHSFSDDRAAVSDGSGWGFINREGTVVIECGFDDAGWFNSEGCCMVYTEGSGWRLISLYAEQ